MTNARPARTNASRINARLPADVARKVAYLERRTGRSTTEVVLESIEKYYAAVIEQEGTAAEILARCGFVGCAEGSPHLSRSYKKDLSRSLGKKELGG